MAQSGSEALSNTRNFLESLITAWEGMDITDLDNPIVLAVSLLSILVGFFILAKLVSRGKNTDLDKMKARREHNRQQQTETNYNKYLSA